MRAYSADLRGRVLADCDGGLGTRAVAAKYRVSEAWVRRLKQVRREVGRTTPADQRRGPTPGWVAHADAIRAAVAADPDATLADVGEFRLEVYGGPERLRTARFAVLRRQYGQGSLFALVASGTAPSLFAAMRAAEKAAARTL